MAIPKDKYRKTITVTDNLLKLYEVCKKYPSQTFSQFVETLIMDCAYGQMCDSKKKCAVDNYESLKRVKEQFETENELNCVQATCSRARGYLDALRDLGVVDNAFYFEELKTLEPKKNR